jgi:outer membrane protein assembly factor BamB
MNRQRASIILLFAVGTVAVAQPPAPDPANLRGDSGQTRKRLAEAREKLEKGHAADAVDALQRVLDDAGDDLVAIDAKQFRPARWVAHQYLARLPADTLKGYQDRIDEPARKLLDAAKKTRDPAPLWQLLDRYFVSRPSDEGLLLLGDLLFEKGEFRAAERVWRRLLPDAGADVVYPDSKADPAAVRARLVLAAIFAGDTQRAKTDLAVFEQKHPGAKGRFAGKDGPYADALRAHLDAPPKVPPTANPGTDWPTFGGGTDRAARVGGRVPNYWPGRPWQTPLPPAGVPPLPRHHQAPPAPPQRPPLGHPVVAHGRVFVTDGYRVFGYDLLTGNSSKWGSLPDESKFGKDAPPEPCPALTAAGNRLYVRIGPPLVRPPDATKGKDDETAIVCLGPTDGQKELDVLWRVKPPEGDGGTPGVWEGAPLVAGRRMWAAYARFEGGRVVHGIACYDPSDSSKETGPPRLAWAVDVCDSPQSTAGEGRPRQELLTLAGRNVVFNSNAGAVVALDAVSGRRAWGFRYPRSSRSDANRSPDPSPAVASGGRLFVAPTDGERVYALDPETGQLQWESGPTEGAQIVGVAQGRLIVAVAGRVRGLRGLSVTSGSHSDPDGWVQHDGGGQLGYGRGFVTDDVVVWPTQGGLQFRDPYTGHLLAEPKRSPLPDSQARYFGNVVYADGVMVVVTPTQVWGYVSDVKRFGQFREQSGRDPVRAEFETLAAKAEAALADGDAAAARELLAAAARGNLPRPLRAWAAARLLLLTPKVDSEAKLPADLRAVLTPELRAEWVLPPDGIPATVGTLLDRHLGREVPLADGPKSPLAGGAWKPGDAPNLSPDAEVVRTAKFGTIATPLRWLPGTCEPPTRLFATTADELIAVPLAGGEQTRHAATDHFTHVAEIPEGFVVAGPMVVAVYAAGRTPVWVFRVPTTAPLPARPGEFRVYSDDVPPTAELSAFRLSGSWLVAHLGDRHLIALDLKGKRVAWVLGAHGKPAFRPVGFPDATQFGPEFLVTGRMIVAQLSDGRRWFVSLETGKPLEVPAADRPTAKSWWTLPPARVDANRLAVSDGPGLVRLVDSTTGRVKWSHQQERESSLTGEPPQARAWGDALLVAVRRNHGVELDRLDAADGKPEWPSGPAFLDADRVNLAHADADADRVYLPAGNVLAAVALKDGKPAWEAELPETRGAGGWVVRAGRKCVIAYPEFAIPREPVADVLSRVARSFRANPEMSRLPGLAVGLYDAWVTRSVPVLLFDPETGKELARFDIPAAGPHVTVWFDRDLAVVATGNRICWLR